MNHFISFKHLFTRVNIPSSPNLNLLSNYENNKTILNTQKNIYSSFYKNETPFSAKELHKNSKTSNKNHSKIIKNISSNIKTKSKGNKRNILYYKSNKYSTIMTQTPIIINNPKKSRQTIINSFRNKKNTINIKKNNLNKNKDNILLSSYHNSYLNQRCKNNNNICINYNINKTINNVIVDNNVDLLKEIKYQTVNNFNNKYKLKFRTKSPKIHNKVNNIFSLLKLYKFEDEKIFEYITLNKEKPTNIRKIMKNNKILFNEKDFAKNISLIEKDFDIKNKLKNYKKFVSLHTLDLIKNKSN